MSQSMVSSIESAAKLTHSSTHPPFDAKQKTQLTNADEAI